MTRSFPGTSVQRLIIGTAGHIDHGKTRLVMQLTGVDTDRLPEEKARGISIDLGFAHWEPDMELLQRCRAELSTRGTPAIENSPATNDLALQFGIVDVPGHERFVKNMVAGATGINLALLIVAADDGVMPQTREHLEIMQLLGVPAGLVAVTKIDLVEPEFVELVVSEVEDLVAGTFLEGAPIVPVSSQTGTGLDELRAALVRAALSAPLPEHAPVFRMPIDRVFSIEGHGTIVTGSVLGGEVRAGDTLELLPQQREVRVRSVENHGMRQGDAGARQRTAVNLAGVRLGEVERGNELATPGYLQPTQRLVVKLTAIPSATRELKDRQELNLHLGTAEETARLVLKGKPLPPGETGYAELRLKSPVAAAYGQRFVLRRVSPAVTVAGGTILDPYVTAGKRLKDLDAYAAALDGTPPLERLSAWLSQSDAGIPTAVTAAWKVGVPPNEFPALIDELKSREIISAIGESDRPLWLHRDRLAALARSMMRMIHDELARHQPRRALPRNTLLGACRGLCDDAVLSALFDHLLRSGELVQVGPHVGPADMQVQLTKKQRAHRDRILEQIESAGLAVPTLKELAEDLGEKPAAVETLLHLCCEDGLLVRVGDLHFAPAALDAARTVCQAYFDEHPTATMAELRDALGTTRKYAIPLFEHFDAVGVTRRQGDLRSAGPNIQPS